MKLVIGALLSALFFCSNHALAQAGASAGPPVASFAPVTGVPIPVQSASGRFSSLNPPNRLNCSYKKVSGRVVSPRLILVKEMNCGRPGHDNVLVNVQLGNPSDVAQMVPGRRVAIAARFKSAQEDRDPLFFAEYLIAEKAELVAVDPLDRSAPPAQAFTSYMMCQPPELDALATQLGNRSGTGDGRPRAGAGVAGGYGVRRSERDLLPSGPKAFGCSTARRGLCPGQLLGLVQDEMERPLISDSGAAMKYTP